MSTQEKRGWVWTREEKRLLQTVQRKLRKEREVMTRFLAFSKEYVHAFDDHIRERGQQTIAICDNLLALRATADRKFRSVSIEQVMGDAQRVLTLRQELDAFLRRPEVAVAIEEGRRRSREDHEESLAELEGRETRATLEEAAEDILLRQAPTLVSMAQLTSGYGGSDPSSAQALQRLYVVQLLKGMHRTGKAAAEVERILKRRSKQAPIKTTLVDVLLAAFKDSLEHPVLGNLQDQIGGAMLALESVMRELKEANVSPERIERRYFTVAGVDLSLDAVNET